MPRTLEIVERRLGDRCCDRSARPSATMREASALARDFDVLAHPVRLQLLDVLARNEGRVCVCDLEAAVPVKQPTVSHHLRLLVSSHRSPLRTKCRSVKSGRHNPLWQH